MLWRRKNASDETSDIAMADPPDRALSQADIRPPIADRKRLPRSPRVALEPERITPPTRRSKVARHPMVVAANAVFMIVVVVGLGVGGALLYGKSRLDARGPLAEDRIVNIPRAGVRDVADTLEREGVIDQPLLFIAAVIAQKSRGDLKSGEYQFGKQASLQDVINTIIDGKIVQHVVTMPEGLTSEQIVQRLLQIDFLAGNIREIPREGTMLPETYRFTRGTTRESVIQRMQQSQKRVLQEAWERRASDLPLRSPDELLVLASIVEKETGKAEERTRVAAVFSNRLKQKMKLQSDPTIIYGLVGGKGTLGRPIQRNEITQATPYNTYTIDGLPPGPIANPGRASIEAAANPARTKELFFVADGTGGHTFSETLDQHQKGVARLRALEKEHNDSSVGAIDVAAPSGEAPQPAAPRPRVTTPRPPPTSLAPRAPSTPAPPQAVARPRPAQ